MVSFTAQRTGTSTAKSDGGSRLVVWASQLSPPLGWHRYPERRNLGRKGEIMTAESGLKWFLRFISITTVPAFVAAVMPQSWVVFMIHELDPEISIGILVTYLWRIVMLLYAFVGLLCLFFAADIRRYLPLIWVLGVGTVIFTVIGLIALFAGVVPEHRTRLFWIVFGDFADGLAKGIVLVALLSRIPRLALRRWDRQDCNGMDNQR